MSDKHFNWKHGKSHTKVYRAWRSMKDRCLKGEHKYYSRYGGRGITICDRWKNFENFYADMGDPSGDASLDRVDNDGCYCPENCRWATKKEQSVNRSITRWVEHGGERLHAAEWARRIGVSTAVLYYRLKKFGTEKALTMSFGRWNTEVCK